MLPAAGCNARSNSPLILRQYSRRRLLRILGTEKANSQKIVREFANACLAGFLLPFSRHNAPMLSGCVVSGFEGTFVHIDEFTLAGFAHCMSHGVLHDL